MEFIKKNVINFIIIILMICILCLLVFNIRISIFTFHTGEKYKMQVDEKFEEVIKDYNDYIKLNPLDNNAYYNRGYAHYRLDNDNEAIADFKRYKKFGKPDANWYRFMGNIYSKNDKKKAIKIFSKGIEKFPDNSALYNNRAYTKYLNNDDLQDALADVNKSLAIEPKTYAYHTRAEIERVMGLYQYAISDSDKALELDENTLYCYCEKGISQIMLGQEEAGRENLQICKERSEADNDYKYQEIYDKYLN